MILGIALNADQMVALGVVTLALLVFTLLVGKRIIKFKGRTHLKVHRISAYVTAVLAVLHALVALAWVYGWGV